MTRFGGFSFICRKITNMIHECLARKSVTNMIHECLARETAHIVISHMYFNEYDTLVSEFQFSVQLVQLQDFQILSN